jgi:hypothetical protein
MMITSGVVFAPTDVTDERMIAQDRWARNAA